MVIYTVVFGDYNPPFYQPKFEGIDYVCFTDNPDLALHNWQLIDVSKDTLVQKYKNSSTLKSRLIKLLPHYFLPNYKQSIFIDSNFIIKNNPLYFVKEKLKIKPMWAFNHLNSVDKRSCIYNEAEAIHQLYKEKGKLKDNLEVINQQIKNFRIENYPENNGLIKSGVLIRNHQNKEVINTMELWAEIVLNQSKRDQLSFNYAAWKTGLDFGYLEGDIRRGNPYFKLNGGHQANYKEFLFKSWINSITARFK